jgi:Xaa-Pro aminopeptidase
MNMFDSKVYTSRRERLHKLMKNGIAVFIGNAESPFNYPANAYRFRQDSTFLYYFGIDLPDFAAVMDFDSGIDIIFGNDFDINDIIWTGPQPTVSEIAKKCGIDNSQPFSKLEVTIHEALAKGRKVHFLPPYRGETKMTLSTLLKENPCQLKSLASVDLIKAVVEMRSIKEIIEIQEIEKAVDIAYEMHTTAMKMCKYGIKEQEIFGKIEGIALSKGAGVSFPIILSVNGQTLHNHSHENTLSEGKLLLVDAGAETDLHYASDITRVTPVGGKFSTMQKDIYDIVLKANIEAINAASPDLSNKDVHILACKVITGGLKDLGLIKGNIDEAVEAGAHALFMPHGVGHMLGLDVHDMENFGENFVGYGEDAKRSDQFGMAYLRFALRYKPGHVFTIEPGCYFIPELIDKWRSEGKFKEFINYEAIGAYMSVGGIRIEDNVLITDNGSKKLGKPIPKSVNEIEEICSY